MKKLCILLSIDDFKGTFVLKHFSGTGRPIRKLR